MLEKVPVSVGKRYEHHEKTKKERGCFHFFQKVDIASTTPTPMVKKNSCAKAKYLQENTGTVKSIFM
jgi:hypothetical protein